MFFERRPPTLIEKPIAKVAGTSSDGQRLQCHKCIHQDVKMQTSKIKIIWQRKRIEELSHMNREHLRTISYLKAQLEKYKLLGNIF